MCKTICLRFPCGHVRTANISPCRGTYQRSYRDHDEAEPACSTLADSIAVCLQEDCPWCARKEAYRTIRDPVEYIRTVNYNSPTAATRKAVREAEAKYDRDMAILGAMNLTQPGKGQWVRGVVGREKVKGGSPLRRELKVEDLKDYVVVEEVVEEGCESQDEDPSPSLMGEVVPEVEDDGEEGESTEVKDASEERKDSPMLAAVAGEDAGPNLSFDMIELGSHPLCCCRPGYLCEYC